MAPEPSGNAVAAGRTTVARNGRRMLLGAVALALLVTAAACGNDGRKLREPDPAQTTTTATTPVAAGSSEGSGSATTVASMRLSSPDFSEGDAMPAANTCAGEDVSPALTLTNVPMGTAEVAIVVRDLDAQGFVHWVIANVPAQGGGFKRGQVPDGAVQATNDFGTVGWRGPCPPSGTHRYTIQAYALTTPSGMADGMAGKDAASLIESSDQTSVAAISVKATAASSN